METTPETDRTMILHNGQSTCFCGKTCKNPRGLKIHQTKMGCAPVKSLTKRAGETLGETEEEVVQESYHSDHSLHVSDEDSEHNSIGGETARAEVNIGQEDRKRKIKWSSSTSRKAFEHSI